ncbi:hypothetical protein [Desertivirga xinjiangensis]|uniref:hypothetical protein n=1 Tax=Desertivirga xinjiangensis TaxID=539206 RepID=UPI00210F0A0F|nr:hypothetical protein [Pedobacter xinjiangensis]
MRSILLLFFSIVTQVCISQPIGSTGILKGYTFINVPSNRQIVGAKWVAGIGATTSGLPPEQLIESQSLSQQSLSNETLGGLKLSLKSILGLGAFSNSQLSVELGDIKIITVKDLYSLPLVKNEKVIFEAAKVSSIDIIYSKELEGSVRAKLPNGVNVFNAGLQAGGKKRATVQGENLYIAQKIVKISKIETDEDTQKIKNNFKVDNLMGYDIQFDNSALIYSSLAIARQQLGPNALQSLKDVSHVIAQYSPQAKPVLLSINSNSQGGTTSDGMFSKEISFCYCKAQGPISGRLFLLNKINSGDKVTFDNIRLDEYAISYSKLPGVTSANGDFVSFTPAKPQAGSKVTILRKTYHLQKVED